MRNILLTIFFTVAFTSPAHAQVVISEVLWIGSDLSTADEWFEITVVGESAVELFGWRITSQNSKGEEKEILLFDDDTSISPGEFYIVSNYNADASRLANAPDAVTSAVSLANSKLLLRIYDASGSVIDFVDDGVGVPFAGGKSEDGTMFMSMERIDLLASGEEKSNWRTASTAQGLDPDAPMFGTPGYTNGTGDKGPGTEESSSSSSSSTSSSSSFSTPLLVINEVLANTEGKDDNEWIELANFDATAVALDGMKITIDNQEFIFPSNNLLLVPGEHISLRKTFTGLSLPNKGGHIQLWEQDILIHELEYASTVEGVSYGKLGEDLLPFCIPSEGKSNKKVVQKAIIHLQSGKTKGEEKVTLNLEARTFNGSLGVFSCYWEYSDGFRSDTCNPPSHTFEDVGQFSIELRANNVCGDSIVEVLHGVVYEKGTKGEKDKKDEEDEKDQEEKEERVESSKSSISSSSSHSSYSSYSSKSSHSSYSSYPSSQSSKQVAGVSTLVRYEPPKEKYEHTVPEDGANIDEASSPLLAMFQDQTVQIQEVKNDRVQSADFPLELALFLAFVVPGWWFLRSGLQKKYSGRH